MLCYSGYRSEEEMNFNVYVPKELGWRLKKVTKELRCSRNSIIAQALREWLNAHQLSEWPKNFFDFEAIGDAPDFKALRSDLLDNISEDPLA